MRPHRNGVTRECRSGATTDGLINSAPNACALPA